MEIYMMTPFYAFEFEILERLIEFSNANGGIVRIVLVPREESQLMQYGENLHENYNNTSLDYF